MKSTKRFIGRSRGGVSESTAGLPQGFFKNFMANADQFVGKYLSNEVLGFTARVVVLGGVVIVGGGATYKGICKLEERKPIAQRWCPKWTDITLLEKIPMEDGSDVVIFRFALPHQYDQAGYKPISSVLLRCPTMYGFKRKKRWYTPISHPNQRGTIEFAIKLKDPGYFSAQLRKLQMGGKMEIGPWVKEFQYYPSHFHTLDAIVAGSGISPVLQLLTIMADDKNDTTKLRLLYCNLSPSTTPFFKRLIDFENKFPDRFEVKFCADNGRWDKHPEGAWAATKGWTGTINKDFLNRWLGPPEFMIPMDDLTAAAGGRPPEPGEVRELSGEKIRRRVLISGPGAFMTYIAGRATMIPFLNIYWQGPYVGMLKEMGYRKAQIYQFANPWTITTQS
jgi:ferredoxin-NADP reductase